MDQRDPQTLNIISFNCWGLKYISKLRKERLQEIGNRLASAYPVPDIVGLQECWTQEDYENIRKATRTILPHGKFYFSGIPGSGLAILSKWPIEESSMFRYPLNGRPTAFFRGDWFVGKGVACAKIRYGLDANAIAEVFCTHLHAPYESDPHDSYLCHRTAQAWEMAKLLKGAADRGHLVLALGDFNTVPLSLAHRLITGRAPVLDAWRVLHPESSLGAVTDAAEKARARPVPDVEHSLVHDGATCDSARNTWRWDAAARKRLFRGEAVTVGPRTPDPRAKRLDYIFVGAGLEWHVRRVGVGMTDPLPSVGCSLSDHFSVEATLSRSPSPLPAHDPSADLAIPDGRGAEEPFVLPTDTRAPLSPSTYCAMTTLIHTYTLHEVRQRRLRLTHFFLSVLISAVCLVAIWWSPHNYVSFVLMLVSTLGLSAGVIDGLIGGLFVASELRALREFAWEVRAAAEGGGGADTALDDGSQSGRAGVDHEDI